MERIIYIQMGKKNERERMPDILKGLSIFFVVYGHVLQDMCVGGESPYTNPILNLFIYTFHMPLFGFISGYLFYYSSVKSTKDLVLSKSKSLLVPILVWGTIGAIIKLAIAIITHVPITISLIWNSYSGIWFLWAIWTCTMIAIAFCKIHSRHWICRILILIVAIVVVPNPEGCLFLLPYFAAGFFFQKNKWNEQPYFKNLCIGMIPVFGVLFCFFEERDYIFTSGINPFSSEYGFVTQVGIDLYRYLVGFVGIGMIAAVIGWLHEKKRAKNFLDKYIYPLGQYTLQIYVLQRIMVELIGGWVCNKVVAIVGYNPLMPNLAVFDFVFAPIIAVTYIVFMCFIIKQVSKNKFLSDFMFGR